MTDDVYTIGSSIYELVRDAEAKMREEPAGVVARRVVRRMSAAQRAELVLRTLTSEIEFLRRGRAREVERQAFLATEQAARAATAELDRVAWLALQPQRESEATERRAYWERYPMRAPKTTRIYREWASTPSGQEWLERDATERVAEAAREDQRHADMEASGGPMGWLYREVGRQIENAKALGRLELTRELLESSFALGDGRSVTWGEATESDHRQRMAMLGRQAAGISETMAIHETAVAMLRASDARCLSEIAKVAA